MCVIESFSPVTEVRRYDKTHRGILKLQLNICSDSDRLHCLEIFGKYLAKMQIGHTFYKPGIQNYVQFSKDMMNILVIIPFAPNGQKTISRKI